MRGARDVGDARIRFVKGFLSQLDSPKWEDVKEVVRNIFQVGSGCGCLLFLVLGAVVAKGRWSVVVGNFLLWPLSSNRSSRSFTSFLKLSSELHMRWALYSLPLKLEMAVAGC